MGSFGTSSSANTGNVVFGPVGAYVVTLTATDNNNCSNTGTTVVSLLSPTVNAIVPPTVCIAQQMPITPLFPYFTATVQSSEPSTTWQMGDGNTVVFPIPLPPVNYTRAHSLRSLFSYHPHLFSSRSKNAYHHRQCRGLCGHGYTYHFCRGNYTPFCTHLPQFYL